MKTAAQILTRQFQTPHEETKSTARLTKGSTAKPLPQKWTAALIEKLRLRYMSQWTAAVGEDQTQIEAIHREWSEVLSGCTGEQIRYALDTWDSRWPPNCYEFRALCRQYDPPQQQAHKLYQALPAPKRDPAQHQWQLARLRSALKGRHDAHVIDRDRATQDRMSRAVVA